MLEFANAAQGSPTITISPDRSTSPDQLCNRCGFAVVIRPWGCKNPCANCGTVYPLGDRSD